MPISGKGWELQIVRESEQEAENGRRRTVGRYQVFHDGVEQDGGDMHGMTAETKGPGANYPADNGKRIEQGRYPIWTQEPGSYCTWDYADSDDETVEPKPSFELKDTGARYEILLHPGSGFLRSIGCINPCTSLPGADEPITYQSSRRRVISLIEDMKRYVGAEFPDRNGKRVPKAFVVIDGEP